MKLKLVKDGLQFASLLLAVIGGALGVAQTAVANKQQEQLIRQEVERYMAQQQPAETTKETN